MPVSNNLIKHWDIAIKFCDTKKNIVVQRMLGKIPRLWSPREDSQ